MQPWEIIYEEYNNAKILYGYFDAITSFSKWKDPSTIYHDHCTLYYNERAKKIPCTDNFKF